MEANGTCTICDHSYDGLKKKPLVLPCSHFFCQSCLKNLEAAGDKRCPLCRQTWGQVRVADLSLRYQLNPVKSQAVKGEIQEADSYTDSPEDGCDEHNAKFIFWCESCDVPFCKKCWTLMHKECEFVLIEDKYKLRKQQEVNLSLLKEKVANYAKGLILNEEILLCMKSLIANSNSAGSELSNYKSNVLAWQDKARKILSPEENYKGLYELSSSNKTQQKNWSILEELEKKIGNPPSSFLIQVAASYQSSSEDVDTFISALKSSDVVRRSDEACDETLVAKTSDLSIEEAVAALTEGGDWVVLDVTSAAAVQRVLLTTSIRPNKVVINWQNMPEKMLMELQTFIYPGKTYQVEAIEIMKCFPNSTAPCVETRGSTTVRLETWIRPAGWAALTQFWGHLKADAIRKLPATIKSVGLVLREANDMKAVNELCGTAFGGVFEYRCRDRLMWLDWNDLSLSMAKTFKPEHWKMTWKWDVEAKAERYHTPKSTSPSLSEVLSGLGVGLRLHLPQLLPGDTRWMGALVGVMNLGNLSGPLPLFIHDARIDLDPLLGMLRDTGQRWDVHLPTSPPQLVQRNDMAKRYKEHGHSLTWDLERRWNESVKT